MQAKEREVVQLLRDYNLKYPSGGSLINFEAIENHSSHWPLNSESLKRMSGGLVGQTYTFLDHALTLLRIRHPVEYRAIRNVYLVDEAAPSDLAWYKSKPSAYPLVLAHDRGISLLAGYLANVELYVRWPSRRPTFEARKVEDAHAEAWRIYNEFLAQGDPKTVAVQKTATISPLSEATIWRMVKTRSPKPKPKPKPKPEPKPKPKPNYQNLTHIVQ